MTNPFPDSFSDSFPDSVLDAAKEFHERAGVPLPKVKGPVVEVAHQPLFLPSPGFFEKIALGCWLAERRSGVCVFGFVDDDFALFPSMWSCRLPARNKNGYEKIGFDYEPQRKAFFVLPKPSPAQVRAASEKTGLTETLSESWSRSRSLSEFNALAAAKICSELGLNALFFEYSKLPQAALAPQIDFLRENQKAFVSAFNESLEKRGVIGIKKMADGELPLWRVKHDGSKNAFRAGEKIGLAAGERVSFKAAARNIVFASLLGSSVYVSGAGALSEEDGYAAIAHDVARELGASEPETFVWRNKNVYRANRSVEAVGVADVEKLKKRVEELKLGLGEAKKKESALLASVGKSKRVSEEEKRVAFEAKKNAERVFQKAQHELFEALAAESGTSRVFSIADLLKNVEPEKVKNAWFASLGAATPSRKEFYSEYATVTRFV